MVKTVQRKFFILIIFFAIMAGLANTVAAAVKAQVDRRQISVDDTFTLIVDMPSNGDDISPDLSPLEKDFDVLGTTASSRIQIINGRSSSSRQWLINLAPKRVGQLTIPPLVLGNDKTNPVSISVIKATAAADAKKDVFLEAVVDTQSPYVQEQVLLTVKLFHRVKVREGALSKPQIDNATVERLGDDHAYETQRGGERYRVVERRYAVFPQKSGPITISGLHFDGKIPDPRTTNRGDFFGRGLFDDPFDLLQPTISLRARADAINLTVKPIPAEAETSPWLPARDLQVKESWSDQKLSFVVGQPITRTLTLSAQGLTQTQLPSIEPPVLDFANVYPDHHNKQTRIEQTGLVSDSEQKIAIIPTREGTFEIPPVKITWWNVTKDRQAYATLPARTITVSPAPNQTSATGQKALPARPSEAPIHNMEMETVDFESIRDNYSEKYWRWGGAAAAFAWILTTWLWLRDRRRLKRDQTTPLAHTAPNASKVSASRSAFKSACANQDPTGMRATLIAWVRSRYPDHQVHTLADVAKLANDENVASRIHALDRALYGADSGTWDATGFFDAVDKAFSPKRKSVGKPPALPPLYPA